MSVDANTMLLCHFDGNYNDDSPSGHTLTPHGGMTVASIAGVFDGGVYGDGNGDYITIPSSTDFNFGTGDFTIDFRFKPENPSSSYPAIISNNPGSWTGGSCTMAYDHAWNPGKIIVSNHDYSSGGAFLVSSTSPTIGTSYHIALVRNGNRFDLYLNGTSQANKTWSGSFDFSLGGLKIFGGNWDGSDSYCKGTLDELRLSNIARWTGNFTVPSQPYGGNEQIENFSMELSAYFQVMKSFKMALRAHDGIEFRDFKMILEALKNIEFKDFKMLLNALNQKKENFSMLLNTANNKLKNFMMTLAATDGTVLKNFMMALAATDGTVLKNFSMYLKAIKATPAFRSVTAHRLSSVIHEVS